MKNQPFTFDQIHIEVARNATDDFNLFHDKHKWLQITHNPFKGPIVLGYQLNTLIEHQIRLYRETHHENQIIAENNLLENSQYFQHYFNWFNKDFLVVPFVPKERFRIITPFFKRKNKYYQMHVIKIVKMPHKKLA